MDGNASYYKWKNKTAKKHYSTSMNTWDMRRQKKTLNILK